MSARNAAPILPALLRTGLATVGMVLVTRALGAHLPVGWFKSPGAVGLALLLTLLAFVAYAERFRASLRVVRIGLTANQGLRLTARAVLAQMAVPITGAGDFTRLAVCRRWAPGVPAGRIAVGIVLDHLLASAALLTLASPWAVTHLPYGRTAGALLLGTLITVTVFLCVPDRSRRMILRHGRWLWHRRGSASMALAWSLLMQGLLAAAVFTLASRWGFDIGFLAVLGVVSSGALLQLVPVSLGGLHLGDVASGALYAFAGLPLPEAVILASALYCLRISVALLAGVGEWGIAADRRPVLRR